ncbi:MAG: Hsp70 family protein, partial [Verrucomicrobiota bacterium]
MIAGIDLGTTNSLAGLMESGFPVLVADEDGRRLTPSAVFFEKTGAPVVGWSALELRESDPSHCVTSVKRLVGRRANELPDPLPAYALGPGPGGWLNVLIDDVPHSPEKISSLILSKLKADLERSCGKSIDRAVITVPAYFNDAQRAATKRAGELAGFTVERILSEPTAAALAYGLDRLGEKARIAVYDLGGGTFDVSILELNRGVFEVLSTHGDTRLGGDDLDEALAAGWGITIQDAAKIKCALCEAVSVEVSGKNFTRLDLEKICLPILERTRAHCRRALADARLEPSDLDSVILVGGATRMPLEDGTADFFELEAGEIFSRDFDGVGFAEGAFDFGRVLDRDPPPCSECRVEVVA